MIPIKQPESASESIISKKPRGWQLECFEEIQERIELNQKNTFLVYAGVGSGKTFLSMYTAAKNLKTPQNHLGRFDRIVVFSNSKNIRDTWINKFHADFNIELAENYRIISSYKNSYQGISVTYQALIDAEIKINNRKRSSNLELLRYLIDQRTFVILDEVHHCAEKDVHDDRAWGDKINYVAENAGFILSLTGTPFRSDDYRIPFVNYEYNESTGLYDLQFDYSYSYRNSVDDNICCPVRFHRVSATVKTLNGDYELSGQTDALPEILNQALEVPYSGNCWFWETFKQADTKLNELNEKRNENYAGLIVCKSVDDAKTLHRRITEKYGNDYAWIVTSQDENSNGSEVIEEFKKNLVPWIVSVDMVSEGVDIPRIRTIIYGQRKTTPLYFAQVMGRGIRNPDHQKVDNMLDVCHMYIPDYPIFNELAANIEQEISHSIKELEEKKKQERLKKPKLKKASIPNLLIESTAEYVGSTYRGAGYDLIDQELIKRLAIASNTSEEQVMTIQKMLMDAGAFGSFGFTSHTPEPVTLVDKRDALSSEIQRVVGQIHYKTNLDFREIHSSLNQQTSKCLGENNSCIKQSAMTLKQLQTKLSLAKKWKAQHAV